MTDQFSAADMATAKADGFRDSAAEMAKLRGQQRMVLRLTARLEAQPVRAAELATRLRNACTSVRNDSYPLADLIPLMQQAADALGRMPVQPAPLAAPAGDMAKLRGQRMVLCSLLGECLPVIDALMQMPGDDDSDARLNGLAGRITGALNALAEERVKGGES